jgi:hypothetical protein
MSFDLAVFDPSKVPEGRAAFLEWWDRVRQWAEPGHDNNNPHSTTPALHAWFMDIIAEFPPMNGPLSKDELPEDEATATDYTIADSAIYAAFAWSIDGCVVKETPETSISQGKWPFACFVDYTGINKAEDAGDAVARFAQRHRLGIFNVSSPNAEVYLPGLDGELELAHSGKAQ